MYQDDYRFARYVENLGHAFTGYGLHTTRPPTRRVRSRGGDGLGFAMFRDWTVALQRTIGDAVSRVRDRLRRRAAIRELSALSDRTLRDIGLPRHQIITAVDEQFARDAATTPVVQPLPARAQRLTTGTVAANDEELRVAGCG